MTQQKVTIQINPKYSKKARLAIAKEVIDFIVERTREDGLDKNNRKLASYSRKSTYSPSYKKSLDFRIAGKDKDKVDLTLTGEMLDSLKLLSDRKGEIVIGYDKSDKELNGKVEGNRLGTYGNSKPVTKPRDFLGITKKDLREIERQYPVNDEDELDLQLEKLGLYDKKVDEIIGGRIIFEGDDG